MIPTTKFSPKSIVDDFNNGINDFRQYDSLARQGNHSNAEIKLRDCSVNILRTLESIAKNYAIDLINRNQINQNEIRALKASNTGLRMFLEIMQKNPKLTGVNVDLSSISFFDLFSPSDLAQIRNPPSHGVMQTFVVSVSTVKSLIEQVRNLILIYIDKNADLKPIENLKKKKKIKHALESASKNKIFSDETARILSRDDREVEIAEISENLSEDPVFSCFVIDASGSMAAYSNDVISSHSVMLNTLRDSAKCKNDALYVVQYLFSDKPYQLNPFEKLDSRGKDSVVLLNSNNYKPNGTTALYKTIFHLLQDMAASIDHSYNEGIISSFTIAVITDGEDTEGGVYPAEIKAIVQELRAKKFLRSSVVIGLLSQGFNESRLDQIKDTLGFEKYIPVNRNPKEIRRAFMLASQSSVV